VTLTAALSAADVLARDERDGGLDEIWSALNASGICADYVPEPLGGSARSMFERWEGWRSIAREDPTAAIAHGATYAGATPVWLAGQPTLQRRIASLVLRGGVVGLGLTERGHGADLLSMETRATETPDGYSLTGEKWLISNADRSDAVLVFARTRAEGGPRGFSWFCVEKSRIPKTAWTITPRVHTHGIRAAEIAGIRFDNCPLTKDALVGEAGAGLEVALKSLQVTRTLTTAAAVGGGEAALRVAMACAPLDEDVISDAQADLHVAESVALASVRALHVAPEQASVMSAAAKILVPSIVVRMIERLADELGWRACTRDGPAARFQLLRRDLPILSIFEGSEPVNLQAIAVQLDQLLQVPREDHHERARADAEAIGRLTDPLARFDAGPLDLTNRGRNSVIHTLLSARHDVDVPVAISEAMQSVVDSWNRLRAGCARRAARRAESGRSTDRFDMARAYVAIHGAACALTVWRYGGRKNAELVVKGIGKLLIDEGR